MCGAFAAFADMYRAAKNLSNLVCMVPAKVKQGDALSSCFSSHTVNKHHFHGLFIATFFTFLCSLLISLLFKMAPKHTAEVLSSVPKCYDVQKKKIHV